MEQIYRNTNTIGTVMTYKAGTTMFSDKTLQENIGTCASQSTLWLSNITKKRPELTAPEQGASAVMFARNWIRKTGLERVKANIEGAGLKMSGANKSYSSLRAVLSFIAFGNGYYLIEMMQGHYIACSNTDKGLFLFDPNVGLYRASDKADFVDHGLSLLTTQGWMNEQTVLVNKVVSQ